MKNLIFVNFVFVAVILIQLTHAQTPCPTSAFTKTASYCYIMVTYQAEFSSSASSVCQSYASSTLFYSRNVASFTDLQASGVLGSSYSIWIGMQYVVSNGSMFYLDNSIGSATDYITGDNTTDVTPWMDGQPSTSGINETTACVVMTPNTTSTHQFSLVSCKSKYSPVCIAPIGSYTSTSTTTSLINTPPGSTTTNEMDYILNSFLHKGAGNLKCSVVLAVATVMLSFVINGWK